MYPGMFCSGCISIEWKKFSWTSSVNLINVLPPMHPYNCSQTYPGTLYSVDVIWPPLPKLCAITTFYTSGPTRHYCLLPIMAAPPLCPLWEKGWLFFSNGVSSWKPPQSHPDRHTPKQPSRMAGHIPQALLAEEKKQRRLLNCFTLSQHIPIPDFGQTWIFIQYPPDLMNNT